MPGRESTPTTSNTRPRLNNPPQLQLRSKVSTLLPLILPTKHLIKPLPHASTLVALQNVRKKSLARPRASLEFSFIEL
jgi:hypothetical protein